MGRRGYPPEFRRKTLDLVASGRSIAEVAAVLGISAESIYTWRKQDRIDKGEVAGLTSVEKAELRHGRASVHLRQHRGSCGAFDHWTDEVPGVHSYVVARRVWFD